MIRASWADTVKRLSGITGVSPVWGDRPEWYIWISEQSGPYALVLEDVLESETGNRMVYQGLFAIKCFPAPQSAMIHCYSDAEREMLKSSRFDHTHTPVYESRSEIPSSFFNVAGLTVTSCLEGGVTILTLESLDSIRLIREYGCAGTRDTNDDGSALLRNVPGWEIGYPLFDSLISLAAFSFRMPPRWFRLSRSPGFEHVLGDDDVIRERPCARSRVFGATVLFAEKSVDAPLSWLPRIEEGEEILSESALETDTGHVVDRPDPHINPVWCHLGKAEIGSHLTTICGCCDHDHHCSV